MPWVLDDDVALRERERRLDDAYHTRRWPYTDGRRRRFADGDDDAYGTATDDDDDALLHRGYGLPRQSGDVVVEDHVHHARPGAASCAAGPRRSAAPLRRRLRARGPATTDRMAATHAPRHERHVTVVDHEHPVYVTREVVHRHRRVRYEHDAERHVEVPGRVRAWGGCGEGPRRSSPARYRVVGEGYVPRDREPSRGATAPSAAPPRPAPLASVHDGRRYLAKPHAADFFVDGDPPDLRLHAAVPRAGLRPPRPGRAVFQWVAMAAQAAAADGAPAFWRVRKGAIVRSGAETSSALVCELDANRLVATAEARTVGGTVRLRVVEPCAGWCSQKVLDPVAGLALGALDAGAPRAKRPRRFGPDAASATRGAGRRYEGELIDEAEADRRYPGGDNRFLYRDDAGLCVDATNSAHFSRWLNHSRGCYNLRTRTEYVAAHRRGRRAHLDYGMSYWHDGDEVIEDADGLVAAKSAAARAGADAANAKGLSEAEAKAEFERIFGHPPDPGAAPS
ncbi:hypothetical protein JL720_9927 [Aureococcus anophagefferens]|nr:hypothetical protein JL720_9927 [Aureococcus anophagefferens]